MRYIPVSDYSKIGPKFRITITEPVREDLDFDLEVGQRLKLTSEGDRIILEPEE